MSQSPLQSLNTPSSPSAAGVNVSVPVDVSTAIRSAASSSLDSSGSQYNTQTGSFTVGGASGANNTLLILGGVALAAFFIMRKFK